MTTSTRRCPPPTTRDLAPGVRLHVVRTRQFATTLCRIVAHRPLGPDAATAAVLTKVLASATERHPTRRALADALADRYGASLHVGVGKLGDRQLLTATLEWPKTRSKLSLRARMRPSPNEVTHIASGLR